MTNNENCEVSVKMRETHEEKDSPGWFGVPDRVIFERQVVEIPIHVINTTVFIQEKRLFWVICVAPKSYGFGGEVKPL